MERHAMVSLADRIPNGIHEAQNAPHRNRRKEHEKRANKSLRCIPFLYVPLPGFGLLF